MNIPVVQVRTFFDGFVVFLVELERHGKVRRKFGSILIRLGKLSRLFTGLGGGGNMRLSDTN